MTGRAEDPGAKGADQRDGGDHRDSAIATVPLERFHAHHDRWSCLRGSQVSKWEWEQDDVTLCAIRRRI